jgi:hypothetical protein
MFFDDPAFDFSIDPFKDQDKNANNSTNPFQKNDNVFEDPNNPFPEG